MGITSILVRVDVVKYRTHMRKCSECARAVQIMGAIMADEKQEEEIGGGWAALALAHGLRGQTHERQKSAHSLLGKGEHMNSSENETEGTKQSQSSHKGSVVHVESKGREKERRRSCGQMDHVAAEPGLR
ncbi:unnamed protein product [Leuciscus chuanchicus]